MTDSIRTMLKALALEVIALLPKERLEEPTDTRDSEIARERATDPWTAWAVPAICEVLAEHVMSWHVERIECWSQDGTHDCGRWFQDQQEWREHVAPLIARRIGCDPSRAIAALQDNRTG
jgi:hypothetical protein